MKNKNQKNLSENKTPQQDAFEYKFLFDYSPDAIFIHPYSEKKFGIFLDVNRTACERLGYTHSELCNKTALDITIPIDGYVCNFENYLGDLNRTQEAVLKVYHVAKDGRKIPVEIHSKIVTYKKNKAILCMARDISAREDSEKNLKKRNDFLELISKLNDLANHKAPLNEIQTALVKGTQDLFASHGAILFALDESGANLVTEKLLFPANLNKTLEKLLGTKIPAVRLPVEKMPVFNKVLVDGKVLMLDREQEIDEVLLDFGNIDTVGHKLRQHIIKAVLPKIRNLFQIKVLMYAPLGTKDNPLGMLGISSSQVYTEDDKRLYNDLAVQVTALLLRKKADQALKYSEDKFRRVIQESNEGFTLVDEQGTIVQWNQAMEPLIGMKAKDTIGQKIWDVQARLNPSVAHSSDFIQQLKDKICGYLKNGKIPQAMSNYEQAIVFPDGRKRFLFSSLTAIKTSKGYMLCSLVRDITERKTAQERLVESEARYRYFVEQTSEGFYRTEPVETIDLSLSEDEQIKQMYKQTRIVEANDIFARMYGFDKVDLILGIGLAELYGGSDIEKNIQVQRNFIRNGYKIINAETMEVDRSGNQKFFLNNAIGIIEENHLLAVWGTQRDITEKKKAELALIESESRFRKVSELTSDYAFGARVDEKYQLTFEWITGALERITGFTEKELEKKGGWETLILPEDLPIPRQQFKNALAGKSGLVEYRVRDKSGRIRWMRDQADPVWDAEQNRTIYIFGAVKDISEQKIAEQALIISEERYKNLFQYSPDAIFIHPFKEKGFGKFIEVNEIACKRLGYSRKELLAKSPKDISRPSTSRTRGSAQARARMSEDKNQVFENEHIHKDGHLIPVEIHSTLIQYKGEQTIFSVSRDISERKKAELNLRESEAKYRQLIEQSGDAIFLIYNGRFELINKKFSELFGVNLEQVGQADFNLMELVAPENHRLLKQQLGFGRKNKKLSPKFEFTALNLKGEQFLVEATISHIPFRDGQATQAVLRDITERKRLEEQLRQAQKMEAVGQLAGGVAHDFNNLLTIISGYSELLLSDASLNDKGIQKIQEILKAADRAQQLTNHLLAFSRKQIFKPQVVNINQVISNSIKMYTRLISEDIKIDLKLSDSLSSVMADPHQLEQILMNLLVNARDAIYGHSSKSTKKKITIETAQLAVDSIFCKDHPGMIPGKKILLKVSDTGTGIPEEQIKQIFDPFFTTKGLGKGTGLGLSTVYGIVKQNKANVYVISEVDKGTDFSIFWPAVDQDEPDSTIEKLPMEFATGSESLLLVEDDPGVRGFTVNALNTLGYRVHAVNDADEALKFLHQETNQIDLVLTDVVMPGLSGQDLAKQIKKYFGELPVIFISGYTDSHLTAQGALDEHIYFIQKPYSIRELSKQIQRALSK